MGWGNRIKERRTELGISQAELGTRAGFSQQTIGDYETEKGGLKVDQAARLADALGVNVAWLAFGLGAMTGTASEDDSRLDREMIRQAIIAFDKLLIRKGLSRATLDSTRKAEMILAGYDLALLRGGPDNLERELERIFAIAQGG